MPDKKEPEKENLPAVQAENTVALPQEDPWAELRDAFDDGSEQFLESFGVSMPRIKTDFGRNGTGFVFPDDHAEKTLEVVILAYPPSRSWWEKGIDEGPAGPPDCTSFDMHAPSDTSPHRQAQTCAECKWSQWSTSKDGDREKPACAESVNCFVYSPSDEAFFWLRFKGTSIAPYRSYISTLKSKSLPAFAVLTQVSLDEKSKGKLEWLVPRFAVGRDLTAAEVAPMRDVARTAMASFAQVAEVLDVHDASEEGPFDQPHNERPFSDDDVVDAEVI